MFLLAESGSSKTDWILADEKQVFAKCQTKGLNPYFVNSEEVSKVVKNEVFPLLNSAVVEKVFFYGSGCAGNSSKKTIYQGLSSVLNADIFVEHDMTASARALFSNKSGIACILGTGSNTCLYDGNNIIDGINSLGYVLGDEGSGAYIGKKWMNAFFNHELPTDLSDKFQKKYQITLENVLENVYKKPTPNQYLASFSPFLSEHISNHFVEQFLEQIFDDFFKKMVFCYSNFQHYPLGFVGSIAFAYRDIILKVAQKHSLQVDKIIKQPADDLLIFHQKKL